MGAQASSANGANHGQLNDTNNDNDIDEGTDKNQEVNKDKYKDRDWMIKVIEAEDDDDNEYEEEYLLSLHNDVWESLFNTIIDPIVKHCKQILANKQMKDTKYIFLVGGFANSNFFQMRMKTEFESYKNLSIEMPELPGLCVVDGSARYGLDASFVKIRRLAKTYGIEVATPKKDLNLKKFPSGFVKKNTEYNEEEEIDYVQGCFSSLVRK